MSRSKHDALTKIHEVGLIPIVRAPSPEDAFKVAEAIAAGGIGIAEITMTVPNAIRVMERVAERFGDKVLLGLGPFWIPKAAAPPCWRARNSSSRLHSTCASSKWRVATAKFAFPARSLPPKLLPPGRRAPTWSRSFPAGRWRAAVPEALRGHFPTSILCRPVASTWRPLRLHQGRSRRRRVGSELVDLKAVREGRLDLITANARQYVEAVRAARAELAK